MYWLFVESLEYGSKGNKSLLQAKRCQAFKVRTTLGKACRLCDSRQIVLSILQLSMTPPRGSACWYNNLHS
jgi:hypothetical protein